MKQLKVLALSAALLSFGGSGPLWALPQAEPSRAPTVGVRGSPVEEQIYTQREAASPQLEKFVGGSAALNLDALFYLGILAVTGFVILVVYLVSLCKA